MSQNARMPPHRRLLQRAMHLWWRFSRPMTLGVRAALIHPERGVFLIEHTYTPGWYLPGGGVEAGETVLDALTREIADAAGSERLIGGQMEDLLAEQKTDATAAELEFIHLNKTGAMLTASLVAGGLCGGASEAQVAALREAGRHLGLAFQIIDDILDATADTATLGKTAGKDAKAGKTTYVKLHGLDASRRHARGQSDAAKSALARLPGGAPFLTTLVENMAARTS